MLLHISITHLSVVSLLILFFIYLLLVKGGNRYDEPENE